MLDENLIVEMVRRKVVADTFRRLTPEKKERVYRAGVVLFGRYGYDGLAVDRFCKDAGISKGSFFQYFPSKLHLLEFVVLAFDHYLANAVAEMRSAETAVLARDRLQYLYHRLVVNSRLHPDEEHFYLFATSGVLHARVSLEGIDLERHFYEYVNEIVGRGVETGEIRGDFDPDLTAHLVSLILGGLIERRYATGGVQRRHIDDFLISFIFDGIKP